MNKNSIKICGLKLQNNTLDTDQDGVLDSTQTNWEKPVLKRGDSDTSAIIDKLNKDAKDPTSNFRTIDFYSKQSALQHNAWSWHDSLTDFAISPTMSLALTRSLKRNSNSIDGWNKELSGKIITGERMHTQNTGFTGRIKNAFSRNKDSTSEPPQLQQTQQ